MTDLYALREVVFQLLIEGQGTRGPIQYKDDISPV